MDASKSETLLLTGEENVVLALEKSFDLVAICAWISNPTTPFHSSPPLKSKNLPSKNSIKNVILPFVGNFGVLKTAKTHSSPDGGTFQGPVHFAIVKSATFRGSRRIDEELMRMRNRVGVACLHEQLAGAPRAPPAPGSF